MRAHNSSGDLLADKRFGYAEALREAGDVAGAADLYAEAAARAPAWAPAYLGWGLALEALGDRAGAARAFAQAEQRDMNGALGAGLHRVRLAGEAVEHLPAPYVAALFDQYAPRFESHLVETLAYRGPEVILGCLAAMDPPPHAGAALDLGCGTGLMARALATRTGPIDGIDLSPVMAARAKRSGLYRRLMVGDCVAAMGELAAETYALVLAADVLVYLGDLGPTLRAARRLLMRGGLFAATVQAGEGDRYVLGNDLRFHHSAAYVRAALNEAGLVVAALQPCTTRQEKGQDVPGLVFAARTP